MANEDANVPTVDPGGSSVTAPRLAAKRTNERWVLGAVLQSDLDEPPQIVFNDGSRQRLSSSLSPNTAWVQAGSLRHDVAADPDGQQQAFESDPSAFVIRILREGRPPLTKQQLEPILDDLHMRRPGGWWEAAAKGLKAHDHIETQGGKYRWSDRVVPKSTPEPRPAKKSTSRSKRFGEVTVRHVDPETSASEQ